MMLDSGLKMVGNGTIFVWGLARAYWDPWATSWDWFKGKPTVENPTSDGKHAFLFSFPLNPSIETWSKLSNQCSSCPLSRSSWFLAPNIEDFWRFSQQFGEGRSGLIGYFGISMREKSIYIYIYSILEGL